MYTITKYNYPFEGCLHRHRLLSTAISCLVEHRGDKGQLYIVNAGTQKLSIGEYCRLVNELSHWHPNWLRYTAYKGYGRILTPIEVLRGY